MKEKIILIGGGGHAKACIDVIESSGQYDIAGIVDTINSDRTVLGYPILGDDGNLKELIAKYRNVCVSIGQIKSSNIREKIFLLSKSYGAIFPVIVSPLAHVSRHSEIGEGTIIMHGAIVQSDTRVGKNCILNDKSLVEHDCLVGDHTHISTSAVVNGGVCIGNHCFIGSNSIIFQGLRIAERSIVGAGAIIKNDTEKGTLVK